MKKRHRQQHQGSRGFTLLELSIVLLIISVIVGSTFAIANRMASQKKTEATQENLDRIEAALLAFRTANNRLPCPADGSLNPDHPNYGIEAVNPDPNNATCTGSTPAANFTSAQHVSKTDLGTSLPLRTRVVGGMVPIVTLGLDKKFALDGYSNKISYHIDAQATETAAFSHYTSSNAKCFDVVIDDSRTLAADNDINYIAFHAVYALISHGADGHGAFSQGGARLNNRVTNSFAQSNAAMNAAGVTTTYINRFFLISHTADPADPTNVYDDVVRFKTRNDLRTAQDSPAVETPDLAVSTFASATENGWHIYFRCKDRFIMEDTSLVQTDNMRIYNFRFSSKNEFMAAGTGPSATANHFELWTYDGFKTDKLPDSSFTPRNSGEAQSIMWAKDDSFFIVSSLDGAANLTGCNLTTSCNRIRVYERTGPRTFVSKDRAIENVKAIQCDTTDYSNNGQACIANVSLADTNCTAGTNGCNTLIFNGGTLIQQISPDNQQLVLANNSGTPGEPLLYRKMPDNTFKHVPNAFDPPIGQLSTNWPVWTPDMRYLFFPGIYSGARGYEEMKMYRNDGNFRYSLVAKPYVPTPAATYGAAMDTTDGSARTAAFSPNGRFLAAAFNQPGGRFRIFELKDGDRWERIPLANIVHSNNVSINPANKFLKGSSGSDNARVERVEFSPDGRYLAVGMQTSNNPVKKLLIFRIEGNVFTLLDRVDAGGNPIEGPIPDISALSGSREVTAISWRALMPWEAAK